MKKADKRCALCQKLDLCCDICCKMGYCVCENGVGNCCHLKPEGRDRTTPVCDPSVHRDLEKKR